MDGTKAPGKAQKATLHDPQSGRSYELPILSGTIGPQVIDVRKLYGDTGYFTYDPGYTSTGRYFPDDSLGHLGYTGTSVWVVPSRRTTVAFLTNRIHPKDDLTGIRAARPLVHDAVAQALGWDR